MDETGHAAFVDRWLERAAKNLPETRLPALLEMALAALWSRGHVTLGEVTLGAVTERVFYYATERYPFLASLTVDADGIHFEKLRESMDPTDARVTEALRFALVQLLSVLGNLTDDTITPSLQSAVFKVSLGDLRKSQAGPTRRTGDEGEGRTT